MTHAKLKALLDEREVLNNQKSHLKWLLFLALGTWPLGFFLAPWACGGIFFIWMTFYVVGQYVSYSHQAENARRLRELKKDL